LRRLSSRAWLWRQSQIPVTGYFDPALIRDRARFVRAYPVLPTAFRAVHRYRFHPSTEQSGYDVTPYGDTSQAEFYAYGDVE
jgi:hypothetical protein